jgi:hypothetical protein
VVAVGRSDDLRGLICRFDGATWIKTTLSGVEELRGVWVDETGVAIAVGSGGAIRQFTDGAWSSMTSPTQDELFCVWGSSRSDVYAAGWRGALIHYDGEHWRRLLPATNRAIYGVSVLPGGSLVFVGETGSIWSFAGMTSRDK